MYDLDQEFNLQNIYFYVNKTIGFSAPLLLNSDATCFINLYSGEKIETSKLFPFKKNQYSQIETHNFAYAIHRSNDIIIVHRLWWILKYTKYLNSLGLIKKLKYMKYPNNSTISFREIIEINEIISNSKQLNKDFKLNRNKENAKTL